jgi:hypothetical protein
VCFSSGVGQCRCLKGKLGHCTYGRELSGFIDVCLEIPLSTDVERALLRVLLVDFRQQLPQLFRLEANSSLILGIVDVLVVVVVVVVVVIVILIIDKTKIGIESVIWCVAIALIWCASIALIWCAAIALILVPLVAAIALIAAWCGTITTIAISLVASVPLIIIIAVDVAISRLLLLLLVTARMLLLLKKTEILRPTN